MGARIALTDLRKEVMLSKSTKRKASIFGDVSLPD